MKKWPIHLAFLAICIGGLFYACLQDKTKEPVPVEYFKVGQILFPDYVCPDTLIVVDADGLNKGMGAIEQGIIDGTDGDIDSILHSNCKIK